MKQLLSVLAILFSFSSLAQAVMDTIVINDYKAYAFIHGPGKSKVPDAALYEIAKDSVYYNGKGYFKTTERNYIIIKDYKGKIKSEGEYFDYFLDGKYIEYDKMGRKIIEGEYKYQPGEYVKVKRKKVYKSPYSMKVGAWVFYGYKNYLDTTGFIERQTRYDI